MKSSRAFTLIELLIAITILTAVAAFVVPTYQLILAQLQLNSATSEVADYVREAEQNTVTQQVVYGVTFTTNATSVPLYKYVSGTKTTQSTLTLPSNIVISQVNFSGNSDIMFQTSGAPTYSGSIYLEDTVRSRQRELDIRPSGAVIDNTAEF